MKVEIVQIEPEEFALVYKSYRNNKQWQGFWQDKKSSDILSDVKKHSDNVKPLYRIKKRAVTVRRMTLLCSDVSDAHRKFKEENPFILFNYRVFYMQAMCDNGLDPMNDYRIYRDNEMHTVIIEQRIS